MSFMFHRKLGFKNGLGHLGGSVCWASYSGFWLKSPSQGCGMEPCIGLCSARSLLDILLSLWPYSHSLALSQINRSFKSFLKRIKIITYDSENSQHEEMLLKMLITITEQEVIMWWNDIWQIGLLWKLIFQISVFISKDQQFCLEPFLCVITHKVWVMHKDYPWREKGIQKRCIIIFS